MSWAVFLWANIIKNHPLRKKEVEKSEYWGWGGVGAAACTS